MLGVYYDGKTSQAHACSVRLNDDGRLEFREVDVDPISIEDISVSGRVANLPRQIFLPDGALFETQDQQGVEALIEAIEGKPTRKYKLLTVSFYETNLKALVAAALFTMLFTAGFFVWGIPVLSAVIADNLPAEVKQAVSVYTLEMLDENYFDESELTAHQKQEVMKTFSALKRNTNIANASLLFRSSGSIGANAFALPGGQVVVTDELVELARNPAEIGSVLLHELAHVQYQHGLKKLVESASLYLFISLWIGDAEVIESFSILFFYALLDAKFSRDFERQADAFVLDYARQHSKAIAGGFVDIMEKLEASQSTFTINKGTTNKQPKESAEKKNGKDHKIGDLLDYVSFHPITEERLIPFRRFINGMDLGYAE